MISGSYFCTEFYSFSFHSNNLFILSHILQTAIGMICNRPSSWKLNLHPVGSGRREVRRKRSSFQSERKDLRVFCVTMCTIGNVQRKGNGRSQCQVRENVQWKEKSSGQIQSLLFNPSRNGNWATDGLHPLRVEGVYAPGFLASFHMFFGVLWRAERTCNFRRRGTAQDQFPQCDIHKEVQEMSRSVCSSPETTSSGFKFYDLRIFLE